MLRGLPNGTSTLRNPQPGGLRAGTLSGWFVPRCDQAGSHVLSLVPEEEALAAQVTSTPSVAPLGSLGPVSPSTPRSPEQTA